MSNLKADALADMSVAEMLDLNVEQIEERGFAIAPVGLYAAKLTSFIIPDASEEREWFESSVLLTAVIELADEEQLEAATEVVNTEGGFSLNERYYTKGGYGVATMRTVWGDVMVENAQGSLGQFFSNCSQEGFELDIVVHIKHRVSKPKKTASDAEKAAFEPRTYMEVAEVAIA